MMIRMMGSEAENEDSGEDEEVLPAMYREYKERFVSGIIQE